MITSHRGKLDSLSPAHVVNYKNDDNNFVVNCFGHSPLITGQFDQSVIPSSGGQIYQPPVDFRNQHDFSK